MLAKRIEDLESEIQEKDKLLANFAQELEALNASLLIEKESLSAMEEHKTLLHFQIAQLQEELDFATSEFKDIAIKHDCPELPETLSGSGIDSLINGMAANNYNTLSMITRLINIK